MVPFVAGNLTRLVPGGLMKSSLPATSPNVPTPAPVYTPRSVSNPLVAVSITTSPSAVAVHEYQTDAPAGESPTVRSRRAPASHRRSCRPSGRRPLRSGRSRWQNCRWAGALRPRGPRRRSRRLRRAALRRSRASCDLSSLCGDVAPEVDERVGRVGDERRGLTHIGERVRAGSRREAAGLREDLRLHDARLAVVDRAENRDGAAVLPDVADAHLASGGGVAHDCVATRPCAALNAAWATVS